MGGGEVILTLNMHIFRQNCLDTREKALKSILRNGLHKSEDIIMSNSILKTAFVAGFIASLGFVSESKARIDFVVDIPEKHTRITNVYFALNYWYTDEDGERHMDAHRIGTLGRKDSTTALTAGKHSIDRGEHLWDEDFKWLHKIYAFYGILGKTRVGNVDCSGDGLDRLQKDPDSISTVTFTMTDNPKSEKDHISCRVSVK